MANPRNKKPRKQERQEPSAQRLRWALPLLIAIVTLVVFSPALQNGFVSWDDDRNFLENPLYRGLGWSELRWMFTTSQGGHYQPLSWMTLGLDYLLWGMEPWGYHLTNLLFHAANAVLFFFVSLRLLSLAFFRTSVSKDLALHAAAGLAALIFSIHPLRVESVAWVTARRDVLSAFFFLWTLLCYLRASTVAETVSARRRWMTAAVFVYALSLLSKAIGMTLPVVLLALDVYPLRRLGGGSGRFDLEVSTVRLDRTAHLERWFGPGARRIWFEKVPFFLLAAIFGIVALFIQEEAGALKPLERYGLTARIAQALFGFAFYLWKTIFPFGLSPLYELPARFNPWDWPFVLSGLAVVAVSLGLFVVGERWPAGLAIWVYYLVVLAPVSGLAQTGVQITADRYSYLSCLGWAILAGAGLLHCWRAWVGGRISLKTFVVVKGLVIAIVIGLGLLSWRQVQVWHDSERLWRHVLAIDPKSSIGHNSLGVVLVGRGELKEAIEHYRVALQIDPAYAKAHNNLGSALAMRGELKEGVEQYHEALRIDPAYAKAHYNLGVALARQGHLEEAIAHFRRAVRIDPAYAMAHHNLGTALAIQGELERAIDHFRQALQIQPEFAEAHESLGRALAQQGKRDEAVQHYQEALRILKTRRDAGAAR